MASTDLHRQIARYRALVHVAATLARSVRTEELVRSVHREARTLFTAPLTLLATRTPDGGWATRTLEGDTSVNERVQPRDDGLLERVLDGKLRLENDLEAYLHREQLPVFRLNADSGRPITRSWMGVPLRPDSAPPSVLSVQSDVSGAFTPEDLEFLELLGVHVSVALENAALHERVEHEARTDPLTGLLNRRAFTAQVGAALAGSHAATLVVMDVQDFKVINDTHGHHVGDEVLRGLGAALVALAAGSGHVFRLGGDEFAALLPGDQDAARQRVKVFLSDMQTRAWPTPEAPHVNVGLAGALLDDTLSDWVRRADHRMYAAKRQRVHLLGG
ncbi:sensor domain-containing diguanylate cyclase [Deinococcus sp.]|uniref:sensor domain-containing diguanylate cyclase n=1 Tax=Deinococcus sp. TaxID=47478 RepID=UPI002869D1B2|nr:sensor domain-containing diguanylate cyclase [Deinococcus sp.]